MKLTFRSYTCNIVIPARSICCYCFGVDLMRNFALPSISHQGYSASTFLHPFQQQQEFKSQL